MLFCTSSNKTIYDWEQISSVLSDIKTCDQHYIIHASIDCIKLSKIINIQELILTYVICI